VICDGSKPAYRYLWNWLAHLVQRPWEKPGVSILLLGGQGTGKGTLAVKIIGRLYEPHFLHLQTDKALTGDFNASLESSFVIFADEAFFSGDKKAANTLKAIETESHLYVNPKYQPGRQINSLHRIVSASNNEHAADVEFDDRRKFVLRVSEVHKGDFKYWSELDREIKNGGLEAMVWTLSKMNLKGFQVRDKPATAELLRQKLASLDPVSRWWADRLFDERQYSGADDWGAFVPSSTLHEDYRDHHHHHGGRAYAIPLGTFVEQLKKLCPSATPHQQGQSNRRLRGLTFPALATARAEFESRIGGNIPW
jgi:hypothetical protein